MSFEGEPEAENESPEAKGREAESDREQIRLWLLRLVVSEVVAFPALEPGL